MPPTDALIGGLIRVPAAGDPGVASDLFAALYTELHGVAELQLRRG